MASLLVFGQMQAILWSPPEEPEYDLGKSIHFEPEMERSSPEILNVIVKSRIEGNHVS